MGEQGADLVCDSAVRIAGKEPAAAVTESFPILVAHGLLQLNNHSFARRAVDPHDNRFQHRRRAPPGRHRRPRVSRRAGTSPSVPATSVPWGRAALPPLAQESTRPLPCRDGQVPPKEGLPVFPTGAGTSLPFGFAAAETVALPISASLL